MNYEIVEEIFGGNTNNFKNKCSIKVKNGWIPVGTPFFIKDYICQAFYKKDHKF